MAVVVPFASLEGLVMVLICVFVSGVRLEFKL